MKIEYPATRLILVGGFLGAGKTTLLLRAAHTLMAQGRRVALITNDQGNDLVDTALVRQQRIPVAEVAGGCFCCRFPNLLEAIVHLRDTIQPDVVLAEPVGSCTDLLATVTRPLLAYHGNQVQVAPLTILLDAEREIHGYPEAVRYLYRQQLAEAEILALSKSDRMAPESKAQIVRRLAQKYSPAQVVSLSARTGEGVAEWLATVMAQPSQAVQTLTLDYQEYAAAEAQLSWLNAQGTLWGVRPFSAKNWLNHWLRMIDASLASAGGAIAHIKMQVATPAALLKASLTHSGAPVSWELAPDDESVHSTELAQFILNARVNTTPRILEQAVRQTFAEMTPEPKFRYEFVHFECFSPRPPQPTYHLGGI